MDDHLETLDRATLGLWRTMNTALWGALAAVAGLLALEAFQRLIPTLLGRFGWSPFGGGLGFNLNLRMDVSHWTFWFVLPRYFAKAIGAVIVGFIVGGIVGSRVWRRQTLVAALAALACMTYSAVFIEYAEGAGLPNAFSFGPPAVNHSLFASGLSGWIYDLVGLIAVLTATLWARHVARRHA